VHRDSRDTYNEPSEQKRETALERRLSLQQHQLQGLTRQLVAMRDIVNQAR
jgi:uncharacterized coiled-coil protein SlyX